MNRRTLVVAAILIGISAVPSQAVRTGKPAPSFSLRKLGGGRLALRDLRGKTVLLSFWTSDCAPCHEEAPHLQRLHRKYFDRGLRVIGVAALTTNTVDQLHAFVKQHRITYPTAIDPQEKALRQFGVQEYPLTLLIDGRGVVRWVRAGFRSRDIAEVNRQVVKILGSAKRSRR